MALSLAAELDLPDKFKASTTWATKFFERNHLSLRKSTTLFKLEDGEVVKRALSFKSFVDNIDSSEYRLSNMIAMDEIAVYMGENAQMTVDHTGASSIYMPATGYESARVTCVLAIRLYGTKVTPLLIAKGNKDKIEMINGIHVIETPKAWATQEMIRKWIASTLPILFRGLFIWDSRRVLTVRKI